MLVLSKNKLWGYLLVALYGVIFFQGCTKHENIYTTDNITKVGNLSLEDGNNIFNTIYSDNKNTKHDGYNDLRIYFDKEELSGNEDLDTKRIENEYFVRFSFKNELPRHYLTMVLEPCDMKIEYDDATDYPEYSLPLGSFQQTTPPFDVVFRVETLKKLNYISKDRDKQKDLCLFVKTLMTQTGGTLKVKHEYVTSNKLVYPAEEINSLMTEYESLTQ